MTLYRKYRPQTFADFVNQKHIKLVLQNQIVLQKTVHAYLFSGPRGVGKTTMARLIAKAVNCEKRGLEEFEPCNECTSCSEVIKGNSLDVIEQDAASNRGIDEIRNLKEGVKFAPVRGKFKVFIIDEAHMLTLPAFNALLKTLEEPPAHTIFILATTEPSKLPDTVRSRCQHFDFKKFSPEDIEESLKTIALKEGIMIEESVIKNTALRAQGSLRDALTLLGQIVMIGEEVKGQGISFKQAELIIPKDESYRVEEMLSYFEKGDVKAALGIIHAAYKDGLDFEQFNVAIVDILRERMIAAVNKGEMQEASYYSRMLTIFLKRFEEIRQVSFLPQLPLELAILECIDPDAAVWTEGGISEPEKSPNAPVVITVPEDSHITLEIIQTKWHDIVALAKGHNHSLPVALSASMPIRIVGNKLILGFKFKLHQQVVASPKNRALLEGLIHQCTGALFLVEAEIIDNVPVKPEDGAGEHSSEEDAMQGIDEVFGQRG